MFLGLQLNLLRDDAICRRHISLYRGLEETFARHLLRSAYISIGILTVADDVFFLSENNGGMLSTWSDMDEKIQKECGGRFGCVGT